MQKRPNPIAVIDGAFYLFILAVLPVLKHKNPQHGLNTAKRTALFACEAKRFDYFYLALPRYDLIHHI
ncbi:MAG: hypothetical protein LIO38_06385, partial [Cloacibacillus sp.]|nr:hypothetical protein [Cloacibacillus sp.]